MNVGTCYGRPMAASQFRIVLAFALCACGVRASTGALPYVPPGAEAISLSGAPLARPSLAPEIRREREAELARARARHEAAPDDVEAAIWVGRRLGYLHRYRDAIEVFTAEIAKHPEEPRLYRHRGHRYITVRSLERAIADLERASRLVAGRPDEIEPDGLPNAAGVPTSTLHDNIHYHLGLARYLKRDFAGAEAAYRAGMRTATNDDMRVATGYWWYLSLRQLARDAEAQSVLASLPAAPTLLENHAYFVLLQLFRGELGVDQLGGETELDRSTVGYGVGMWHVLRGDRGRARAAFEATASGSWPAFGAIAAEAELAAGTVAPLSHDFEDGG